MAAIVEKGPTPEEHGVVRWRLIDLVHWLEEQFKVTLDETNVSRELKKLGYVKLSVRPRHHAQDEAALETFKKGASQPNWQRCARGSAIRELSSRNPMVIGKAEGPMPDGQDGSPLCERGFAVANVSGRSPDIYQGLCQNLSAGNSSDRSVARLIKNLCVWIGSARSLSRD